MRTDELYEAFLQSRREQHMQRTTIGWYKSVLSTWAKLQLEHPTPRDVSAWLGTAPSAESARTWRRALKAMYSWANETAGMDAFLAAGELRPATPNPTLGVKAPPRRKKLPRIFTEGELWAIRSAAADARDVALMTVLLDSGPRIGQVATMYWERIEQSADGYTVVVTGKTGDHVVPLTAESYRALKAIQRGWGPIFRAANGRPLTVSGLKLAVRRLLQRAKLTGRKLGPHTFRHTFATMYLRKGGDIHRLQRILGHSSITQTMVYLHLSDPEAHSEHARLTPLRLFEGERPRQIGFEEKQSWG